jgi:hypothetical protein
LHPSLILTAAKEEYQSIKRELSRISRRSSNHASRLEEGAAASDDFNLDDFLNGMNNEQTDSGHKPKHLGVVWRDLVVKVILNADRPTLPPNVSNRT